MKKFVRRAILAAVSASLVYLLFPITSAEFEVNFDEAAIDRKRAFLEEVTRGATVLHRPNILIILADDLGKTDISHYGGETVSTPHIDAIGLGGVTFSEAYCTSPICSPSRAALLTGRYPQRFGFETQPMARYPRNRLEYSVFKFFMDTGDWTLLDFDAAPRAEDVAKQGLPPSEITLGELLTHRGYKTSIVGKWHLGYTEPCHPTKRGFGYQYGFYEAFTLYDAEDDPDIVNHRHDYFASKHIWAQQREGASAIRRNEMVVDESEYLTFAIARESMDFMEANKDDPFFLFVSFSAPHTPFQAPRAYYDKFSHVQDDNKRVYYAMIAALDDAVGMIMDKIEALGLEEDTVVWFASDNGGATYTGATENDPLKGGKFNYFEGGINIPMMLQWKGKVEEGSTFSDPVSLLDIFTTSAALADAPLPPEVEYDGVDLMPYLSGDRGEPPHEVLYWKAAHTKAVRMGPWKLLINEKTSRDRLYNLDDDKNEMNNRIQDHPEIAERLKRELAQWERGLMPAQWPRVMDYRFVIDGEEYPCPL